MADEVSALIAVIRPIIQGVLHSIGAEFLDEYPERSAVPLRKLGRLRKEADGDCGIAFEYAVHDAVRRKEAATTERVSDALKACRITRGDASSILFAIEKQGSKQLIATELDLITDNSRVLSGYQGQPVKLKKHMNSLAAAFRRPTTSPNLPQSIRGLWKADLFLGSTEPDHWVGTSVKINPAQLQAAHGLRIAVVPTKAGHSDAIRLDAHKNLVICPLPHDGSFMQVFYEGWRIVQALCASDFKMPKEIDLPLPSHREAARVFVERRSFSAADVVEATAKFAQPHLLVTEPDDVADHTFNTAVEADTDTVLAPAPLSANS